MFKRALMVALTTAALVACSNPSTTRPIADRDNQLTHGNVQLTLKKGVTNQTEVLESFGAPNITSVDGNGHEVWTYQRHATDVQAAAENWAIFSRDTTVGFSQSNRTITLIIKFDENKIVKDFRSRMSSF